ncbi:MAG: DUF4349 domain-containing protein [Leptospiraceae bacterium]|nr:DUF4349 domain-containing protein [Leptospiraceae bacterium]
MKSLLTATLLFALIINCGKKSESNEQNSKDSTVTSPSAPRMEKQLVESADEEGGEKEEFASAPKNKGRIQETKEENGTIDKPLNPISDASKSRLLEYTIQLNYKVESIEKAREVLLNVVKKESYISSSQTNVTSGYENMYLQIQIPVNVMYETLLQMDKVGQLTHEDIRTQDWTEHNEFQKIKLDRESLRMVRRSKAANKGSAETWNWKDREEALERSEDSADSAKLESWKIKDHVTWAKVNITISGRELPAKIQLPNYKDAMVGAINFLLDLTYYIAFILPILLIAFLIFKIYRWYRSR